ncbi:MAG: GRAS family protein [Pseudomonadota bacterium]
MMRLKKNEIDVLNSLKLEILKNGYDFDQTIKFCNEVKCKIRDEKFTFTYAASLFANQKDINNTIKLLNFNDEPFSRVLKKYLIESNSFEPAAIVFKDTSPYDAFVKTNFYKEHKKNTINAIREFAKDNRPNHVNGEISILDVGCGNGIMLADIVNSIASFHGIRKLNIVLLDPSCEMLKSAKKYCEEKINFEIDIICINSSAQDLTMQDYDLIKSKKPYWFINSAFAFHHMPCDKKIEALKKLKSISSKFLLTEVHFNHDLPQKDSPELVYSVYKFYGFIFNDIINSPLSELEKKSSMYQFMLAEAINILSKERGKRIDYHTPIEHWKEIFELSGFREKKTHKVVTCQDGILTFVMEAEAAY